MRNIKLVIEYDGSCYNGWQKQKDVRTIQQEIENALHKILKYKVDLIGAGRTDSKVHALAQVANFFCTSFMLPNDFLLALNTNLPKDIVVIDVEEVSQDFHARFSSHKKHYRYVINNSKLPSALNRSREYHYKHNIDVNKMIIASKDLIGKHDFKAFMASASDIKDTKREIYDISINTLNDRIIIDVIGNGFLYNMVRIIAGTLLEIGAGKLNICIIKKMLITKNRIIGGKTLPPQGLYLVKVEY